MIYVCFKSNSDIALPTFFNWDSVHVSLKVTEILNYVHTYVNQSLAKISA